MSTFCRRRGQREKIRTYESVASVSFSPVVADDVVYVGSSDGFLYAFPAAHLAAAQTEEEEAAAENEAVAAVPELLWRFKAETAVHMRPTVVDGAVYFGTVSGEVGSAPGGLYALDAANGELLWQHGQPPALFSGPAIADGRVVYGSMSGHLFALDAATAELLWDEMIIEEGPLLGSAFTPVLDNGVAFFLSGNGSLDALDVATGKRLWRFNAGFSAHFSTPVLDQGKYMSIRRAASFTRLMPPAERSSSSTPPADFRLPTSRCLKASCTWSLSISNYMPWMWRAQNSSGVEM